MTQRIENTLSLIANVQNADEAQAAIQNAHPKLSKQAATNVVKDMQDFAEKRMSLSELDYRLAEVGL